MGLLNRHRLWHVAVDGTIVALAWYLAFEVRFERSSPVYYESYRNEAFPWVVLLKVAVFVAMGLYMRLGRHVSLRDLRVVARACVAASGAIALYLAFFPPVPLRF